MTPQQYLTHAGRTVEAFKARDHTNGRSHLNAATGVLNSIPESDSHRGECFVFNVMLQDYWNGLPELKIELLETEYRKLSAAVTSRN